MCNPFGGGTSTQNQQQFQNQTQNQTNQSQTVQNQQQNQQQVGTQAQTQNQQGTSTYNPFSGTMAAGTQALDQARQAASSPFQLPVAPVAGFSADQQQAFQQYRDMQGAATPYFNQAQGLFNQSAAPISAGQINQYMNPYASSILANLHQSQREQMNDMTGRATQTAGGVGADRIGVAQGEMARQQALAEGQTLSGIYGSALSAAQQDAGRQQSAAYGIGNLGGAYQNSLMQGAGALGSAGAQQQQLQQAQLNAPYQNQLAQLALPYQQAQYLAGITGSLAPALGGTTSTNQTGNTFGQTTNNSQSTGQNIANTAGQTYGQTSGNTLGFGQATPAPPNPFTQLAGLGTAGVGAYGAYKDYAANNADPYGGSASNPLAMEGSAPLDASDYAARGGRIGYDEGGGIVGAYPYSREDYERLGPLWYPRTPDASARRSATPQDLATASQIRYDRQGFQPGQEPSAFVGNQGELPVPTTAYARGGYADGGGDVSGDASWMNADPTVPEIHAQPSQANHPSLSSLDMRPLPSSPAPMPAMNFAQPQTRSPDLKWLDMRPQQQQSSGSGGGSNPLGDIASIAKTAAMIIPLLAEGGAVGSAPYQHFDQGGGDASFDDRFNDSATMGEMPRSDALKYFMERQGRPSPPTSYIPPEQAPVPRERPAAAPPRADIPGVYRAPSQEGMNDWHNRKTADLQLNAGDAGQAPPQKSAPEPTGLAAISPAAAQLAAKNKQEMQSANYDVPYGDLNHTQDTSRSFAKSPWMALISAGAGMMASGSPYLGVGIGKGLQAGVENLNKQRESSREEETVNQRAKQLAIQADKHLREYTQLTPNELISAEQKQSALESAKLQLLSEDQITGNRLYKNNSTGKLEKYGPNGPLPLTETDKAKVPQVFADAAGGVGSAPNAPGQPAAAPEPAPFNEPSLASSFNIPKSDIGFMQKGSPMAAAAKKDLETTITAQNKAAQSLPALEQDLAAMKYSYKTLTKDADKDGFISRLALQPGANFGERLESAKRLNHTKAAAGEKPAFDPEKVAAAENINKIQSRMGLTFSSQISPREAFAGQKIGIESSPGLTNSPKGFQRLIAGFEAAAQNTRDEQKFFQKYIQANGHSLGWRQAFEAQNPSERYIVKGLVGMLPENLQKGLPQAVKELRANPEKYKPIFNKYYNDTADYYLGQH